MATELLMDVKNASVVEAWDDFVQCRIMAIPTVSLAEDIMRQAASHRLSSTNNVSNFHNERLIVTPEATVTQCFKDLLMQIYIQKKVGCHLYG